MNQTFLDIVTSRQIVSEISPSKVFPYFFFCLHDMASIDNLGFQNDHLGKKNLILSHLYIKYK